MNWPRTNTFNFSSRKTGWTAEPPLKKTMSFLKQVEIGGIS